MSLFLSNGGVKDNREILLCKKWSHLPPLSGCRLAENPFQRQFDEAREEHRAAPRPFTFAIPYSGLGPL